MFKWKKLGRVFNPVEIKDRDWLYEFAQAPSVLIFDDFVRVYFSCRPKADENGQYVSYSAYVDLNRSNLFEIVNIAKKPILELGKLGTFDEFGTYPVSVIRDGNKILAYYGGWTRCQSIPFTVSIGEAISYDNGQTFIKRGSGPILSANLKDPYIVGGPKIRKFNGKWFIWYVAVTKWHKNDGHPDAVYKIRMASSDDGLNWNRNGANIIETSLNENECQASPDVFFYQNKYHMFFCYKHSLNFRKNNEKERGYRLGYAYSNDMINWTRDDTKVGIDISKEGWDDQSIAYPHIFELDNCLYMFYLGNHVGRFGFGLAKLENYNI